MSRGAAAFRADRVNLADDVQPERLERLQIGNLRVKAAGLQQPLPEIHVVVMVHHLIAGERRVVIAVRQRHD